MSQIKRLVRIEDRLNITGESETLGDQMRGFERGKYGGASIMSVVAAYMHKGEVPKSLPEPLRNWIREILARKKPERSIQAVQDKK